MSSGVVLRRANLGGEQVVGRWQLSAEIATGTNARLATHVVRLVEIVAACQGIING